MTAKGNLSDASMEALVTFQMFWDELWDTTDERQLKVYRDANFRRRARAMWMFAFLKGSLFIAAKVAKGSISKMSEDLKGFDGLWQE